MALSFILDQLKHIGTFQGGFCDHRVNRNNRASRVSYNLFLIKVEGIGSNAGHKKSFKLPFQNILTTKGGKPEDVWPPSKADLSKCADIGDWAIDVMIYPVESIRATIVDPWKKAYLLAIPVNLLST